jgi:hypothetical protein
MTQATTYEHIVTDNGGVAPIESTNMRSSSSYGRSAEEGEGGKSAYPGTGVKLNRRASPATSF